MHNHLKDVVVVHPIGLTFGEAHVGFPVDVAAQLQLQMGERLRSELDLQTQGRGVALIPLPGYGDAIALLPSVVPLGHGFVYAARP